MTQLVDRNGNVHEFADSAEAQAAVASGDFGLRADQEANLVGEDGRVAVFDNAEDAASLLADPKSGFRLASDQEVQADIERAEYSDFGSQAAAMAEGALAGGTLGGSDLAVQSGLLGEEFAEDARKRAEHASTARTVGEVGGIIGSSLLTGGAAGGGGALLKGARVASAPGRMAMGAGRAAEGLVGKALAKEGAGLGRQMLSKGAQLAAGGAVEGAAFGAGQALSRASLDQTIFDDPDLAAERIALGAKEGAIFGGAIGGGLGAAGSAVAHGGKKLTGALVKKFNAKSVSEFIESQSQQRATKAVVGGRDARAVKKMNAFGEGMEGVEAHGKFALDKGIVTATSTSDDIAKAAKTVRSEMGGRMERMVKEADAAGARVNTTAMAADVKALIDDMASSPTLRKQGKRLQNELEGVVEQLDSAEGMSLQEMWDLRKNMDKMVGWAKPGGNGEMSMFLQEFKAVRGIVEDGFAKAGDDVLGTGDDFAKRWTGAKRDYAMAAQLDEMAQKATERELSNRFFSASDYGIGGGLVAGGVAAGGGAGALAIGMVSGMVHKVMRERGSAFIAGSLDSIGRMRPGQAITKANSGQLAIRSAADGVIDRVKTGAKKATKATREGGTYMGVKFKSDSDAEAYQELSKRIQARTDPESDGRQQVRQSGAGTVQESMAGSMDALAQRQADYLSTKLAPTHNGPADSTFSRTRPPRVSPADVRKLKQAVEAVENPRAVLDKVARGDLRRDDVEALKAVYPSVFRDLQETVKDELADVEDLPSYQDRTQLALLLDIPTDPTMEPDFVARMQEGAQQGSQQAQQESAAPAVTPGNAKSPSKTSEMYGTRTERLAGGM